jgi:uncharacterized membrane protein
MPYIANDLGTYHHYSYDPDIVAGTVIAGMDRPGGPFTTFASIWTNPSAGGAGWVNLPEGMLTFATACAFGADTAVSNIVGFVSSDASGANPVPTVWEKDSSGNFAFRRLPSPMTAIGANANGIAATGQFIAGEVELPGSAITNHALRWHLDSRVGWIYQDLGTAGGNRAYAIGVSNAGDKVLGNSLLAGNTTEQAVEWSLTGGTWTATPLALPPVGAGVDPLKVHSTINSFVAGVGCAGWVRLVEGGSGPIRAAIWDVSGNITLLPVSNDCEAADWNGSTVVGKDNTTNHAFAWTATAGTVDIHPAGWDWSQAWAIDEAGTIVGIGALSGETHVLLWREITMTTSKHVQFIAVDGLNNENIYILGSDSRIEILGRAQKAMIYMKKKSGQDGVIIDGENGNLDLYDGGQIRAWDVDGNPGLKWDGAQGQLSIGSGKYDGTLMVARKNGSNGNILVDSNNSSAIFTDGTGAVVIQILGDAGQIVVKGKVVQTADHVFEDGYSRIDLADLEKFVASRRHLPGVPSAAEMKENGVDLVAMNALLLAKLEELTLYLIEHDRRLRMLESLASDRATREATAKRPNSHPHSSGAAG